MPLNNMAHQLWGRVQMWSARLSREQLVLILIVLAAVVAVLLSLAIASYRYHAARVHYADMLVALWADYKHHDWDATTGRTIDAQSGGITTSEGQAYTLMRAVWMNDPATFDATWQWTATHLHRQDNLFSWRWGKLPDGGMGVQTASGGNNTASDADTDIAVALLMAASAWHRQDYSAAAQKIIPSIWNVEVVTTQGQLYMAADDLEKNSATPDFVVNPSYISPYAYRLFASSDHTHDWQRLANNSYTFLSESMTAPLDVTTSAGLPPGWVRINKASGYPAPPNVSGQSTDFGYGAFRVYWRTGLDQRWYGTPAAHWLLTQSAFLARTWSQQHKLAAVYNHAGHPKVAYESLALYAGSLAYFDAVNAADASEIISAKLDPIYDAQSQTFRQPLSYYENNWIWFGIAYEENALPNVAAGGAV